MQLLPKNVIKIRQILYYLNSTLGAGGKLIQSISDDCGGVAIKFPPSEAQSDKVTIRGPKEDVEKAKKMLVELSNERQLNSVSGKLKIIFVILINICVDLLGYSGHLLITMEISLTVFMVANDARLNCLASLILF